MPYSPPDPFVLRVLGWYEPPDPLVLIEGSPTPVGEGHVSDLVPVISGGAEIDRINHGRVEQPIVVSGHATNTIPAIDCAGEYQPKKCDLSGAIASEVTVGVVNQPLETISGQASISIYATGRILPTRDRVSGYSVYVPHNTVCDGRVVQPGCEVSGAGETAGAFTGRVREPAARVNGTATTPVARVCRGVIRQPLCKVNAVAHATVDGVGTVRDKKPVVAAQAVIANVAAGRVSPPRCSIVASSLGNRNNLTLAFPVRQQTTGGTVAATAIQPLAFSRDAHGSAPSAADNEPVALTFSR